jgi:hypothetical protein
MSENAIKERPVDTDGEKQVDSVGDTTGTRSALDEFRGLTPQSSDKNNIANSVKLPNLQLSENANAVNNKDVGGCVIPPNQRPTDNGGSGGVKTQNLEKPNNDTQTKPEPGCFPQPEGPGVKTQNLEKPNNDTQTKPEPGCFPQPEGPGVKTQNLDKPNNDTQTKPEPGCFPQPEGPGVKTQNLEKPNNDTQTKPEPGCFPQPEGPGVKTQNLEKPNNDTQTKPSSGGKLDKPSVEEPTKDTQVKRLPEGVLPPNVIDEIPRDGNGRPIFQKDREANQDRQTWERGRGDMQRGDRDRAGDRSRMDRDPWGALRGQSDGRYPNKGDNSPAKPSGLTPQMRDRLEQVLKRASSN